MIVIAILFAGLLAASIGSVAYVMGAKKQAVPSIQLQKAVRLLDRIVAYDDSVTSLSTELRDEARALTTTYYKELN